MDRIMMRYPGTVKRDPAVDRWLDKQTPALGSITRYWFEVMRSCGDDVREIMHDGCPVVCIEHAPFGYVNAFKAHVNIGFFFGAFLKDPAGLLEGDGKFMRHMKVRPGDEIDSNALRKLIEVSYLDVKARLRADSSIR
jgi:hypothetical protein